MVSKEFNPLEVQTKEAKDEATKNIQEKYDYFEVQVGHRIKKKLPMGDLPISLNKFVEWEVEGLNSVNRSTIYKYHNKKLKKDIESLCKKVKNPKIPSNVEEAYQQEIKNLKNQLSELAGVNLELGQKVSDLQEKMGMIAEEKGKEIERLKDIVNKSENVRAI